MFNNFPVLSNREIYVKPQYVYLHFYVTWRKRAALFDNRRVKCPKSGAYHYFHYLYKLDAYIDINKSMSFSNLFLLYKNLGLM